MEIQITSRHSKASQSLQETITAELEKLGKFFDKITSCHVILDSEHVEKVAEITKTDVQVLNKSMMETITTVFGEDFIASLGGLSQQEFNEKLREKITFDG